MLLADIGAGTLLFIVAGACLLGFVITYLFRIEPKGRSLDEVSGRTISEISPRPVPP